MVGRGRLNATFEGRAVRQTEFLQLVARLLTFPSRQIRRLGEYVAFPRVRYTL